MKCEFCFNELAQNRHLYTTDEDIMENNYMFVMLWNSSVIDHLVFPQCFFFLFISGAKSKNNLNVALLILGRKCYKIIKKSPLYSQSLLIFIHKTPVFENHPAKRKIRELLRPRSTPMGITVYFYMSSSLIYILEIHRRKFETQCLMKTLWKIFTYLLCYGI